MTTQFISIDDVDERGMNTPVVASIHELEKMPEGTSCRVEIPIGRELTLSALVLYRSAGGPLIAQSHGALDKSKYDPPRFERLATLRKEPYNTIFFADPTIMLHERIQLGWYIGWLEFDLHAMIGSIINKAADLLHSKTIVLTGSSGGGFATLQVAPFVKGSIALPMNPQTAIADYKIDGIHMGPQNTFRRLVLPELGLPENRGDADYLWWAPLAHRLSAVERYSIPQDTHVHYWQNTNDTHHYDSHYLPFVRAFSKIGNGRLETFEYAGPNAHVQPTSNIVLEGLRNAFQSIDVNQRA